MGFNDINLQVSGPQQPASIYKTKVLKGQVPFATQVTEPNTKYVIKHNFVLNSDVTIPENCILEFDGGSISGEHTITGQNTNINSGLNKIFNGVYLAGTFSVEEWYVEWFGLKGDCQNRLSYVPGCTDNSALFVNMLKYLKGTYNQVVQFGAGNYYFSSECVIDYTLQNIWGSHDCNKIHIKGISTHNTSLLFASEDAFSFRDSSRSQLSDTTLALFEFSDMAIVNCSTTKVAARFNTLKDVETYTREGSAFRAVTPTFGSALKNIYFYNWYTAIYLEDTYGNFEVNNVFIADCIYGVVIKNSNCINLHKVYCNRPYQAAFYISGGALVNLHQCCTEAKPEDEYLMTSRNIGYVYINSSVTCTDCYSELVFMSRYIKDSAVREINPRIYGCIYERSDSDPATDVTLPTTTWNALINAGIELGISVHTISTWYIEPNNFASQDVYFKNTYVDVLTKFKCDVIVDGSQNKYTEKSTFYNGNYYLLSNVHIEYRNNDNMHIDKFDMFYNGNAIPFITNNCTNINDLEIKGIHQKEYGEISAFKNMVNGSSENMFKLSAIGTSDEPLFASNDSKQINFNIEAGNTGYHTWYNLFYNGIDNSGVENQRTNYFKFTEYGIIVGQTFIILKDITHDVLAALCQSSMFDIKHLILYKNIILSSNTYVDNYFESITFKEGSFKSTVPLNFTLSSDCKFLPSYNDFEENIPSDTSVLNILGVPKKGTYRFDNTNNKPLWSNGSAWVDATGATVQI